MHQEWYFPTTLDVKNYGQWGGDGPKWESYQSFGQILFPPAPPPKLWVEVAHPYMAVHIPTTCCSCDGGHIHVM